MISICAFSIYRLNEAQLKSFEKREFIIICLMHLIKQVCQAQLIFVYCSWIIDIERQVIE